MRVRRDVVTSNSSVLTVLLCSPNFRESSQNLVELKGDSARAMEIWFRVFHDTVTPETYAAPVAEMWELVSACDKYQFKVKHLKKWYASWFQQQDVQKVKQGQLLYPCWIFDHAKGFHDATRHLVYESAYHIEESNPTEHYRLHLPARVIRKLISRSCMALGLTSLQRTDQRRQRSATHHSSHRALPAHPAVARLRRVYMQRKNCLFLPESSPVYQGLANTRLRAKNFNERAPGTPGRFYIRTARNCV